MPMPTPTPAPLPGEQGAQLTGSERAEYVRQMFARIVPRYDLFNTLSTFGQDARWRRMVVDLSDLPPDGVALDVATGTGAVAFALAERYPAAHIEAIDFTAPMIDAAQAKARQAGGVASGVAFSVGDVLELPYPDGHFDAVTVSFGVRNFSDIPRAFAEMRRVLKPGGRFVCLELTHARSPLVRRGFDLYFYRISPLLGTLLSGDRAAYNYLPASLTNFPDADRLGRLLLDAGFGRVRYRLLNFGTIAIHTAEQ